MQDQNKTWTCIVTSAPRTVCTLRLTCESLGDCGWNPIIFAEPGATDLSKQFETFWNTIRFGIWRNWLQSARWALSQTTATHIITVQDDVDFHPETKDWLDQLDWPADTGFISPYTPRPYQTWKNGTQRPIGLNPVKMRSCWTGQSLCFTREVLQQLVDHPNADSWCGLPPKHQRNPKGRIDHRAFKQANPHLIQNSDYIIGSILQRSLGLTLYYPNPSLATHCNPVSSVNI